MDDDRTTRWRLLCVKGIRADPDYTYGRLGGNQNFINNSTTLTIGPAEGAAIFVVGRQGGASVLDLHLVLG